MNVGAEAGGGGLNYSSSLLLRQMKKKQYARPLQLLIIFDSIPCKCIAKTSKDDWKVGETYITRTTLVDEGVLSRYTPPGGDT